MPSIVIECGSCDGTGLYRGMAEGPGDAVVCLRCNGSGHQLYEYKQFDGRKRRTDVKRVFASKGSFILSCGPVGSPITYEEFENGKMPVARKG